MGVISQKFTQNDMKTIFYTTRPFQLKARSHGAFFFCAFTMRKMDYVGVNEGVHMVQFQVHAMHWCVRHCT